MADWGMMVGGWLLAALAGALTIRQNAHRRIVTGRDAQVAQWPWQITVPSLVGFALTVFGGASLQLHSLGLRAVPLAIVPFTAAYRVPVHIHNARLRRSPVDFESNR